MLYKNFRATGLDCRYFGPFRVINLIENNCEIESTFDRKKRFVHCNSLKRFSPANCLNDTVDTVVDLESSDSEEELDCIVKDRIANREDHELDVVDERPYNLRRNRRAPERYGIPIMDYQLYSCTIVAEIETLTNAETLTLCYKEERKKKKN